MTLAARFGESVTNATKCKSTGVPVRNRPGQLPKYLLMLFSTDERAHWDFADQASKAYVDWLYYCTHEEYKANVQHREGQGLLELFPSPEPEPSEIDAQLNAEAGDYLPGHLGDVLYQRGPLRLVDAVEDVYGEMLGRAVRPMSEPRSKHSMTEGLWMTTARVISGFARSRGPAHRAAKENLGSYCAVLVVLGVEPIGWKCEPASSRPTRLTGVTS